MHIHLVVYLAEGHSYRHDIQLSQDAAAMFVVDQALS
jgi:hypothetical protein